MTYTPITESFQKKFNEGLTVNFPEYFHEPIAHWLFERAGCKMNRTYFGYDESCPPEDYWWHFIRSDTRKEIENVIRAKLPKKHEDFFSDHDLVIETLNFLIKSGQYPSKTFSESQVVITATPCKGPRQAQELEDILSKGGHAYKVAHMGTGQVGLEKRVPEELENLAEKALSSSELLREAWHSYHKKDPDFNTTAYKCVEALETKIKEKYYPKEKRPSLGMFLEQLKTNEDLKYSGHNVDNEKKLFDICKKFASYRGQHISGGGKNATKEDAEFILYASILFYSTI